MDVKKSIAFEIEVNSKTTAAMPKFTSQKMTNGLNKRSASMENLLQKLDLASQRKKSAMESKILKARGAIVHAKEIAHKKRQQEFLLKSQYHARLENKLQSANELKEKHVEQMVKKLEDQHVSKIKRARVSKENVYNADLADKVLDKLTAAETRRKQHEELQLKKLKEHAEHAKAVREKKALEEDVVSCN